LFIRDNGVGFDTRQWSGSSGFPAPALDGNSAFLAFPATVSRQ
jgi:hypothetical protein